MIGDDQQHQQHTAAEPAFRQVKCLNAGLIAPVARAGLYASFELYLIAKAIDDGSGKINSKQDLLNALPDFGKDISERSFQRRYAAGMGIFWREDRNTRHLYLIGWNALQERFILSESNYDLAEASKVAQYQVWYSVAGSTSDSMARALGAFLATRRKDHTFTGSQEFLAKLFGKHVNTIYNWIERADIPSHPNYAQYAGKDPSVIPAHAYSYIVKRQDHKDKSTKVRATWRMVNTYMPDVTVHPHMGMLRKARKGRVSALASKIPVANRDDGFNSLERRYFAADNATEGLKRVQRHLRRNRDHDPRKPRFIRLGDRGCIVLHECYDYQGDMLHTELKERDFVRGHQEKEHLMTKIVDTKRDSVYSSSITQTKSYQHTQPIAPIHAPVHLSPVTHDQPAPETDSSQSAMQSPRGIVAGSEPEAVTHAQQTAKRSQPKTTVSQRRRLTTQSDVLKRDTGHELYTFKSRIRIHPNGAILCQPDNVGMINPDNLPKAVTLYRWNGELWIRCLKPEQCTRNALIALCPDLQTVYSDIGASMLDIAVARRHNHLRSSWDAKNQNSVQSA